MTELEVHWQTRGLWKDPESDCTDQYDLQPPPRKVTEEMLLRYRDAVSGEFKGNLQKS